MMIFYLIGCEHNLQGFNESPESAPQNPEEEIAELVMDDFVEPYGISPLTGGILVTDAGTGELWHWQQSTEDLTLITDGLGKPTLMAADDDHVVVFDSENQLILMIEGTEKQTLLNGVPDVGEIMMADASFFVTVPELDQLLKVDPNTSEVTILSESLPSPTGLAVDGDTLWISTQSDQAIWEYSLASGELNQILTFEEVPFDIDHNGEDLLIATRSTRWPYGGWIYSYAQSLSKLIDSPPEAKYVAALREGVLWSSKQSITYLADDAETYEVLGIQTAVGHFAIFQDDIYWTDRQNGRVYFNEIP
jgi:hypothetical protein